jgi:hypothetical protein
MLLRASTLLICILTELDRFTRSYYSCSIECGCGMKSAEMQSVMQIATNAWSLGVTTSSALPPLHPSSDPVIAHDSQNQDVVLSI